MYLQTDRVQVKEIESKPDEISLKKRRNHSREAKPVEADADKRDIMENMPFMSNIVEVKGERAKTRRARGRRKNYDRKKLNPMIYKRTPVFIESMSPQVNIFSFKCPFAISTAWNF